MLMNYEQFCNHKDDDLQRIDEGKIADIKDKILNKSRELGKSMKDTTKKVARIGKREARQTLMALDIIGKKILKGRKITPEEAKFLKDQGKDIARLIPLIAIQGIPAPVPITPFLIAYGRKVGLDLVPKDNVEPEDFKDKTYNPVKAVKKRRAGKKELTESFSDCPLTPTELDLEQIRADLPEAEDMDEWSDDEYNEWFEDGEHITNYQTIEILDNSESGFVPKYFVDEDCNPHFLSDLIYEQGLEPIEEMELTNPRGTDSIKIYQMKQGKIGIAQIDGDYQSDMTLAYFDEEFKNSNLMRSLSGIDKYDL